MLIHYIYNYSKYHVLIYIFLDILKNRIKDNKINNENCSSFDYQFNKYFPLEK